MNQINFLALSFLLFLPSENTLALNSQNDPQYSAPTSAQPSPRPWMKCVSNAMGIIFTSEPNNGGLNSADIYQLNAQGRKIKQIGHAEVLSSSGANVTLQNSSDSPFPFALTFSPNTSSAPKSSATLISATLFTSQTLSQLPLQCKASKGMTAPPAP